MRLPTRPTLLLMLIALTGCAGYSLFPVKTERQPIDTTVDGAAATLDFKISAINVYNIWLEFLPPDDSSLLSEDDIARLGDYGMSPCNTWTNPGMDTPVTIRLHKTGPEGQSLVGSVDVSPRTEQSAPAFARRTLGHATLPAGQYRLELTAKNLPAQISRYRLNLVVAHETRAYLDRRDLPARLIPPYNNPLLGQGGTGRSCNADRPGR